MRLAAVPWFVALLLAAPVAVGLLGVVLPAFGYLPALGGERFSLQPFHDLLAAPGLWTSILLSLACGLATTAISLGAIILFVASFSGSRAFRIARQSLAPLLAVPHAAAAFGLALLIAPTGILFRLAAGPFGFDRPPDLLIINDPFALALIAGLVAKEMPFLLLVTFAALPQAEPRRRLRLARSLGYGRVAGFVLGVWPAVYRQIRLPVLAVAAFASSVVDVSLILGPSTPAPLAVRLLEWMGDPDLTLRFQASAGALLQLAVTLAVLGSWVLLECFGSLLCRRLVRSGTRMTHDRALRIAAPIPVAFAGLAVFDGLFMLGVWSIAGLWTFPNVLPSAFSLDTWAEALESAGEPLWRSFFVGLAAALAALILVVLLLEARRRSARQAAGSTIRLQSSIAGLIYLPLIVPQISFLFGLQIAVLIAGWNPSLVLLVAVHLIFVAPYVALALADPWFALDPRYERMAASLGRSPIRSFLQIRLAMLTAPIFTALAIGFAVSVGQYLPTVLIGAGRLPTITTEAVALSSGGDRRVIGAYALLQTLLPFLAFALSGGIPALRHRNRRAMRA